MRWDGVDSWAHGGDSFRSSQGQEGGLRSSWGIYLFRVTEPLVSTDSYCFIILR